MIELRPCTHLFSNGTEFECFMYKCEKCTRYRNNKCRILNACYNAMFDKNKFPYNDLQESGYAIVCKYYTEEPVKRKRSIKKANGQMSIFEEWM